MTGGIPPASRNHRVPTGCDTPASTAASSLDSPRLIAAQNRCLCSRLATGGRPATASAACPWQPSPTLLDVPCAHLQIEVLRRPVEFAQYTSAAYAALADDCQVSLSVGRKGQCWDNAVAESFFASVKGELTDTRAWPTRTAACRAIVEYIAWYNGTRLHSTLGYRSPADFENDRDGKIRNVA